MEPLRADRDQRLHGLSDPGRRSPPTATTPFPIGRVCPPSARGWSTTRAGTPAGTLGELVIAGPGVMRGYFGQPELTDAAFLRDADGTRWYRTGDLVRDDGTGCFAVPRPSRPDGQETRLPDRAGRDRGDPLPPRGGGPRRGRGPVRGRRGRDRGVRRAEARPEEVDHRHEAALHDLLAALHGPRHDHVPRRPAGDLDRQGRLPAPEVPDRRGRTACS